MAHVRYSRFFKNISAKIPCSKIFLGQKHILILECYFIWATRIQDTESLIQNLSNLSIEKIIVVVFLPTRGFAKSIYLDQS